MNTTTRLAAYGGALVLAFGLAWGIGGAIGRSGGPGTEVVAAHDQDGATGHDHGAGGHGEGSVAAAGGLAHWRTVSESGYMLALRHTAFAPGVPGELAFSVTGSDGRTVTAFDVEHDKLLHLIVVRRDATGFQHLHPEFGPDGVWRTTITLPTGGVYRVFADFTPTGGPALTLGADLFVPGRFIPATRAPSRIATVDGYEITMEGDLVGDSASQLVVKVTRGGEPVTDLEPYLGAFGHLVALRQDDLAYLHVHPNAAGAPRPTDRTGPQVAFTVEVPSSGTYHLYLDFAHGGAVRTAEFTALTTDLLTDG